MSGRTSNPECNFDHWSKMTFFLARYPLAGRAELLGTEIGHKKCHWQKLNNLEIPEGFWRFLEVPGGSWRFLEIPESFWSFLEVSGGSWRFLEVPGVSWSFLELPGASWRFLELSGAFWSFLEVSEGFRRFLNFFFFFSIFRNRNEKLLEQNFANISFVFLKKIEQEKLLLKLADL